MEKKFKATVLAIGNGANCALNCICEKCSDDYNLVNVNTDDEFLDIIKNPKIKNLLLQLDENELDKHLGCNRDTFIGEYIIRKIKSNKELIIDEIEKSDVVILISCLGGGLGSGATPVITNLAYNMRKKVISILTLPFSFEGKKRCNQGLYAADKIRPFSNQCVVLNGGNFDEKRNLITLNNEITDAFLKIIYDEENGNSTMEIFKNKNFLNKIKNRIKNGIPENSIIGFKDLDNALVITEPCVITVGARPCMGKSAFLTSVLTNAIKQNKKCMYFSFEMSKEQLSTRLVCSLSNIPILKMKQGNLKSEEMDKFVKTFDTLVEAEIGIADKYLTIEEISEKVKEYKPDIVFLDYLELIEDNDKNYFNKIKTIAKENNCIIFVASQISRALENREYKRPCLSDLKDNIVNCSDVILFIYRNSYYFMSDDDTEKDLQKAEIIIAKNNYGIPQTVELKFLSEIPKFVEAEDVKSE